ncbi:hypothetical protein O181_031593 [Austropuccinia psidii MF-1]|uniref:Ribosome assembly protein 3 n=1 Tax=Austropuccinia psidii MF-1 TaxID=1389203 RepID=A0A9Q3D007_9BASI|nr:hypothetical protein [Austropuccinia psidii MF-1]
MAINRNRKRKRKRQPRQISISSSDSDSDSGSSSSSSSSSSSNSVKDNLIDSTNHSVIQSSSSSSSDSDSPSSSTSSSSSNSSIRPTAKRGRLAKKRQNKQILPKQASSAPASPKLALSPSPIPDSPQAPLPQSYFDPQLTLPDLDSPPSFALPSHLNVRPPPRHLHVLQSATDKLETEEARFRSWYMTTVVDRFSNELDELRTAPKNSQSQFDLLVAALASGADLFEDSPSPGNLPKPTCNNSDKQLVLDALDLLDSTSKKTNEDLSDDVDMVTADEL